ncbi:MAG: 7-cyano-7-deazaguanine synthase QueC [Agathobacter sp.]|nr:7-cyano-7-deazaguanine synthase QueC [Agathobacter sp.]
MKTVVLASGGLDSTVLLHQAVKANGAENVIALSIYYGQKHKKELEYVKWQAEKLGVQLFVEDLSAVFKFNKDASALLEGSSREIVHESYAEQIKADGLVSAYVPYRNGLFLSYAAAVAMQLGADLVLYGAHADDAAGDAYPDCTPEFIEAQAKAIERGTGDRVHMKAPWYHMNKTEVVREGLNLGMTQEDFEHTWSCYEGAEEPCGTCGTCRDRIAAFRANGLTCN